MQIGLYGGTFNPIHFGHLRTAEELYENFKLQQVVFIPAAIPPHKDADILDPIHRLKMVNLATTGNPRFGQSEVEIHRSGKSYSIDTVKQLKEEFPDSDLAFIMGMDAFVEIDTWHKYKELFTVCDFIVTNRPGEKARGTMKAFPEGIRDQFKRKKGVFVHESGRVVHFAEVTGLDISATRIRGLVRKGRSVRYLLPRRVIEYIQENELYK